MGKTQIYDIECFLDAFCAVFKEPNVNEYTIFCSFDLVNFTKIDFPKKYKVYHVRKMKDWIKDKTIVGFNNQAYDNQVVQWIINTQQHKASEIYKYSTKRINATSFSNPDRHLRDFWDNQLSFSYLDLLKMNHYDNRARMTSLKKLKFTHRTKNLKDLPFNFDESTDSLKKAKDLITYCVDDVDETETCYIHSYPKIKFRKRLTDIYRKKGYNVQLYSYSDVKIGDFKNLISYSEGESLNYKEVKKDIPTYHRLKIKYSEIIPDFIQFKSEKLQKFLSNLKQQGKITGDGITKKEKKEGIIENGIMYTTNIHNQISFDDVIYTFGEGGIHTKDPARIIRSNNKMLLKEGDVGSQYPSEMIKQYMYPQHLSETWIDNLKKDIIERVNKWKPLGKKGDEDAQATADMIKLGANGGGYGKLKEVFNWQYDPKMQLQITLSCQLEMLMLAEDLTLAGFKVISANTDGIVVYIERDREEEYFQICKQWEKNVHVDEVGALEYANYEFLAQTSVNDYIAKTDDGKIKRKGDFLTYEDIQEDNWHKDSSMMIIPHALQEYFVNGTEIWETITKHNNIHDFCIGVKGTKAFRWVISERDPKTNVITNKYRDDRLLRYYVGGNQSVSKCWKDGRGFTLTESSVPVTVCPYLPREEIDRDSDKDRATDPPYKNLNRFWYIEKAQEIIDKIEKNE